uniref:LEM domain-containing protein n=1 Tax=Tetraodon nigroviridis TaxID=99883 RepID=H3C6L0_TETNG
MSNEEIRKLLDKWGIKHGPVVDSTRRLYERKLSEAMSEEKAAKPPSDKTFYREEVRVLRYLLYKKVVLTPHQPERQFEQRSSNFSYSRTTPEYRANDFANQSYTYETPSTYRNLDYKSAPETKTPPKASRLIPLWVQIAVFLAVAVFFYVVFASMETNESFQGIE